MNSKWFLNFLSPRQNIQEPLTVNKLKTMNRQDIDFLALKASILALSAQWVEIPFIIEDR